MTRSLPVLLVVAASACSSQSQTAPGPAEAQTVPTAPEAHLEVTPPEGSASSFPKATKEAQGSSAQLVEQGRNVLKTKGKAAAGEAAGLFAEAVKQDSRNAMAYWELGWAQQIGGNIDAALATWQTLKQLDPKFPDLESFSSIAESRRHEPQVQAHAPGASQGTMPEGEPVLATTPPKKKPEKATGPRQTRPTSGGAAKNVVNGTSEATVPKIPPQ